MMITKRAFLLASTAAGLGARGLPTQARADTIAPGQTQEVSLRAAPLSAAPVPGSLGYAPSGAAPIIRARKGQEIVLRVTNDLVEATSIRWHGLRGLGALDDALTTASSDIPAGESRVIRVTPLDAGTTWFHPAPSTSNQTARGLRGVLVVDEPDPPPVDDDLVVLCADRLLTADSTPRFGSTPPADVTATAFTVNGAPAPLALSKAPGTRLRLRLVNGSVQRTLLVACEGAHPSIIAIDGQPSELFRPVRETVPIGPGARFDLLLDLPSSADASVRLLLKGTERIAGAIEPDKPLVIVRTVGVPLSPRPPVVPLTPNPSLPRQIPLEAAKRADLVFERKPSSASQWSINGVSGPSLAAAPVLRVKRGEPVTLGLINKSALTLPMRVFGQVMRLLHAKDDGWEPYWRDSVLLPPDSRNHVAFVADQPGRWPIEAAVDDLALAGLRCWLEVSPG